MRNFPEEPCAGPRLEGAMQYCCKRISDLNDNPPYMRDLPQTPYVVSAVGARSRLVNVLAASEPRAPQHRQFGIVYLRLHRTCISDTWQSSRHTPHVETRILFQRVAARLRTYWSGNR